MSGSHVRSWYAASVPDFPAQPALEGVLQADVCILGAGSVGCYLGGRLLATGARLHFVGRPRIRDEVAAQLDLLALIAHCTARSVPA